MSDVNVVGCEVDTLVLNVCYADKYFQPHQSLRLLTRTFRRSPSHNPDHLTIRLLNGCNLHIQCKRRIWDDNWYSQKVVLQLPKS